MTESGKPEKKRGGRRPGAGRKPHSKILVWDKDQCVGFKPLAVWVVKKVREELKSETELEARIQAAHSETKWKIDRYKNYIGQLQLAKRVAGRKHDEELIDPRSKDWADKPLNRRDLSADEIIEDIQALFGEGKVAAPEDEGKTLGRFVSVRPDTRRIHQIYSAVAEEAAILFKRSLRSKDVEKIYHEWLDFERQTDPDNKG